MNEGKTDSGMSFPNQSHYITFNLKTLAKMPIKAMAMITTTIAEPLLSVRLWNCLTLENILGFLPHIFIFLVFLPVSSLSCA